MRSLRRAGTHPGVPLAPRRQASSNTAGGAGAKDASKTNHSRQVSSITSSKATPNTIAQLTSIRSEG
jgi:hypothetical protein